MIPAPIFVGGCPRSGTTLLRALLDASPDIACGPELRAFPALASLCDQTRRIMGETLAEHYQLSGEALDSVFRRLMASFLEPLRAKSGKPRIAEKTPANALWFAELYRLFPQADFVQIIRDGRDVVASLLTMDWRDGRTGRPMPITRDARAAATAWVDHVARGREAGRLGARYHELRYEGLIAEPEAHLDTLFQSLNARPAESAERRVDPGMHEPGAEKAMQPITRSAEGRWRRDLSPADKDAVKDVAGDLLVSLGYARDHDW